MTQFKFFFITLLCAFLFAGCKDSDTHTKQIAYNEDIEKCITKNNELTECVKEPTKEYNDTLSCYDSANIRRTLNETWEKNTKTCTCTLIKDQAITKCKKILLCGKNKVITHMRSMSEKELDNPNINIEFIDKTEETISDIDLGVYVAYFNTCDNNTITTLFRAGDALGGATGKIKFDGKTVEKSVCPFSFPEISNDGYTEDNFGNKGKINEDTCNEIDKEFDSIYTK